MPWVKIAAKWLDTVLRLLVNEAMRVERHEVLQAQPYERTATRQRKTTITLPLDDN